MRDFGNDVFAGTAEFYAKYRPEYPEMVFHDIVHFYKLDGRGDMLDIGCGTGELSLPLAKYFNKVLAIDPDPDMLKLAKGKATKEKISTIEWRQGSSKDLSDIKNQFRLIGLGQSFHWMDQETVVEALYKLIMPTGGLFIVGSAPVTQNKPTALKDELIRDLVAKYIGPQRRAGNSIYKKPPKSYSDLLGSSEFRNYKRRVYETKVVRNVEQELGNLYSMSWGRRAYFGERIGRFEQEFKDGISRISSSGSFENLIRFETYFVFK